ncbi:MAG: type IV pilus secretin PilQ [Pseudomonadota bacterium]|nr:type IV pilus secretin PilQ [Pseudomonadota bacterium]HJO36777.1 type IV pilus secretin PilQ [Gammaproteobacteria bacterium]
MYRLFVSLRTSHRWPGALALWGALALPGHALELQDVDFYTGGPNRADVLLRFDGPPPAPTAFVLDQPPRLAIDIPGSGSALRPAMIETGSELVERVTAAAANDRTRVVIELGQTLAHRVQVEGDAIRVALGDEAPATARAPAASDQPAVRNVDFRRGPDGAGRVVVTLSAPGAVADVRERGGKVLVDLAGTALPPQLAEHLDVMDFDTPVESIDVRDTGSGVQLAITPAGAYERALYQNGNRVTLELRRPVQAKRQSSSGKPVFTGEPVSLNFQNVETRAVLQILADIAGKNLVVSDSVTGTVALRLENVPWDQALSIILKTQGLATREAGNVLFIAPAAEIAERERTELESRQQRQELEPLRSEFLQVNYAKAADLAGLLKNEANSLLSPRGNVSLDPRTNTLLVQDTADRLRDIRALVTELDVPVSQVLIESRIVVAQDDFTRDIGARFGLSSFKSINGDDGIVIGGGSLEGTDVGINQSIDSLNSNGSVFPTAYPDANPSRLNVNLPASGNPASLAFAILSDNFLVDLELSALQAEGRGEVIASPRVITANQKTAAIRQGVEVPYQEATASGATSVSFKEAVLALEVTPQITPDDRVIMDLVVNRDSVGEVVPSGFGGFIPSIDTREVITQVLVDNGSTVVLGGIYEQELNQTLAKVPLLGDLPVVGAMFRQVRRVDNKSELLVFVTPKIVKEGLALN